MKCGSFIIAQEFQSGAWTTSWFYTDKFIEFLVNNFLLLYLCSNKRIFYAPISGSEWRFKGKKLHVEEILCNGLYAFPEKLLSISFVVTKDLKTTTVTATMTSG